METVSAPLEARRFVGSLVVLLLLSVPLQGQYLLTNLSAPSNRVDYVIITPAAYLTSVVPLASFRANHDGFAVGVALTDSIETTFGRGVPADSAVKAFILYALSFWQDPKPQYFLLAGNVNAVPGHKVVSRFTEAEDSVQLDGWFVLGISGPGEAILPRATIGRFPAWDAEELSRMIAKTIAYESPAQGSWIGRALAVADYDTTVQFMFEDHCSRWQQNVAPLWADTVTAHVRNWSAYHRTRSQFRELWNEGAAIVSFWGFSTSYVFSKSAYFTTWDIDSLSAGSPLAVFFIECAQMFDRRDTLAMAVRLLEVSGKGAVAAVASSGVHYDESYAFFMRELASQLSANPYQSLGKALFVAKRSTGVNDEDFTMRLTLLGDPALVIKSPLVAYAEGDPRTHPSEFALFQNYPNPFNPRTTIWYALPTASHVSLKIFNTLGQDLGTLVDRLEGPGYRFVQFDASHLSSGVYFYRLTVSSNASLDLVTSGGQHGQAGDFVQTRKMLVIK
jgi:hypothetical protein